MAFRQKFEISKFPGVRAKNIVANGTSRVEPLLPDEMQLWALALGFAAGPHPLRSPPACVRMSVTEPSAWDDIREKTGEKAYGIMSGIAQTLSNAGRVDETMVKRSGADFQLPVGLALARMQKNMGMLDQAASANVAVSPTSFIILSATVLIAGAAPFALSEKLVEVLVPSMSALSAAIGLSAEYNGKVEVARGKEIAAVTLQAASEAECFLAQAERAKAVVPLCVGLSTTFSAFALLAPTLVAELPRLAPAVITEIYLICPVFAVLGAAVAALAAQESITLCSSAIGLGARRFASADEVGRSWLSATEQISKSSDRNKQKWINFALSVLPAPLLALLYPGPLPFRAIVAAATAAAQAAYSLARVEYTIARAVDAVALKSRIAAVSDTYANQGARAGAILPFTSALSGLCAAVTVAVVELLPFIHQPILQSITCLAFPGVGAIIAAAASVSKARCEVDARAATAAATQIAGRKNDNELNELSPFRTVFELVRSLIKPSVQRVSSFLKRLRWRTFPTEVKLRLAREDLEWRFERYDANRDGRLNAAELAQVISTITETRERAERVRREAAAVVGGDGAVSFAQFRVIMDTEWRRYGPPAQLQARRLKSRRMT